MPCSGRSWLADGAKRQGQQTGNSEDILPNFGKPGPSADHLNQAEVARAEIACIRGPLLTLKGPRSMAPMPAYSAKTRFSRGAAKSRKARTLIGRNRLATYTRLTGIDGGWNSSSTVVKAPSSGAATS